MLSNKDFNKFLTPARGGKDKDDSKTWEIKQIKAWDQQHKAKAAGGGKRADKVKGPPGKPVIGEEKEEGDGYRDRALERRNDANPDYDKETERVANLDVEYTKFLGGDTEHTHLVKGLDYMLLQKMKQEAKVGPIGGGESSRKVQTVCKDISEVTTSTALGGRIKDIMLSGKIPTVSNVCRRLERNSLALACVRMAYEFDVDIMSEVDVPTTISRSIKDISAAGDGVVCSVDPKVLARVAEAFQSGKAKLKKKKLSVEDMKPCAQPAAPVVDAVGDIFEDVGKYTPFAPSTESNTKSSSSSSGVISCKAVPGSVEGVSNLSYFESKKKDVNEEAAGSKNVMATVKALMQSQSIMGSRVITAIAPERTKKVLSEVVSERGKLVIEEKGKVHRDVIGGTTGHVGGEMDAFSRGDVSLARGSYDLYPDTGDYEIDSDNEEEEDGVTLKTKTGGGKPKLSRSERRAVKRQKT